MNKMEMSIPVVKTVRNFLLLFYFSIVSCSAQNRVYLKDDKIYTLIEHHYDLEQTENPGKFLYFKSLPVKGNSQFDWTTKMSLSKFINDPIFKKQCQTIINDLKPEEVEILNNKFVSLDSKIFNKNKLSKDVLNKNFLQNETYIKAPDAANRKLTYPIIIDGENYTYGIFVEDAHNEGGYLYIYEFKEKKWSIVCKDSLWLV